MRPKIVKESTKEFFKLHGRENWHKFVHGYLYLAYLDPYVKVLIRGVRLVVGAVPNAWLDTFRPVFAYVPDRYHAKVLTHEDALKIVSLKQDIRVPREQSEKIIPFDIANQIVIRNADAIVLMECPCRREKKNPCQPLDVCMIIGEPYASFMLEHGKSLRARRVSREEAIAVLEGCHRRGNVHNAYFKDAMGDQFYAICNCCSCCCCGLEGQRLFDAMSLTVPIKEFASSGYLATIKGGKCTGCGLCVSRCPFMAISLPEGLEEARVNPDKCQGCSVCADLCPQDAIEFARATSRGIPLDVQALTKAQKPGKAVSISGTAPRKRSKGRATSSAGAN